MGQTRRTRELLFADLALTMGAVDAPEVAAALERSLTGETSIAGELVNAGAIDEETRARIDEELDAALEKAGGDAPLVLARRGGIDGTIHTRLKEETSNALLKEGTGARAPLRTVAPDRYREFALISRGGMGVVYLTLDSELHRRVAFKMVVPDPVRKDEDSTPITPLAATPPSRQDTESARSFEELKVRFLQEAWITGAMEHPGVVPVYELGETEAGIPYYTMRYVRGERTLANAIKETKDLDARLTLIEPFLKACDTIRYAHSRGVIHRDLKPENIALGEFGEAVVLDWGLSKMQGRPDVSAARWRARIEEFRAASDLKTIAGAMGTPGYMAPEAALGESENVGIRSDVYSLGTILFEILTGRLPYRFKTFVEYAEQALKQDAPLASEVDPAVPAELSRICELALSREKEERFESVDKLASRLRRWQTEGALEREVELLMESAHRELENAGELTGNVLLWHLDRASAACTKVLHIRPGHPDAQELTAEIKRLRMRGIRERERGTRRRVLQIAGVLALAIAAIVTLIVASVLNDARADAERAIAGERLKARRSAAQAAVHRKTAEAAQKRLAGGYAGLADSLLARGRVHAAQLAAAKALQMAETPRTWAAKAAADARWAPTLVRVLSAGTITAMAPTPGSDKLLLACDDGKIRVFDIGTGKEEHAIDSGAAKITALLAKPTGDRFFAGGTDGAVRGFLIADGEPAGWLAPDQEKIPPITALAITKDGNFLYAGHEDGTVRAWVPSMGKLVVTEREHEAAIIGFAWAEHEDGLRLYSGSLDGTVKSWLPLPLAVHDTFQGREGEIAAVGVDPHGLRVCAATLGHVVDMWETGTHRESTVLEGAAPRARQALINDAHTRLATVDSEGVIRLWDLARGRLRIVMQDFGDVRAIAQDDRYFVAAAADGTVRVWDLQHDGPEHAQLTMLSADQRRLYVARSDHTIEVREFTAASTGSRRLEGRVESICAMASHEEGNLFFAADLDGAVQSWRIDSGERYRALGDTDAPVTALLYLPEIDRLITGSLNGAVRSWDWKRRLKSTLRRPEEGDSPICRVAATESGEAVFAADRVGTLFGWNQLSGRSILEPVETGGPVVMLAVSPSGTSIAVALEDGRLMMWTSATGELQTVAELPVGATPLAMRCSDFGAITWRSLDGRAWKWLAEGPAAERTDLDQIPTGGAGLPWVLRDPMRRLVVAENRSGLMMEEFRTVAVPAERYDPRPTRLVPWSRD